MFRVIGWVVVALVGVVMAINAIFMLISPSAWFRLPQWVRATGTMREEGYRSALAEIQVRVAGAVMLGVLIWVVYDFAFTRR